HRTAPSHLYTLSLHDALPIYQHPERTGAAGSLGDADAGALDAIGQSQIEHGGAVALVARNAEVSLCLASGKNLLLGLLDRGHDRGRALLVLVDADTEVDLGGARVGRVFAHERQDLVAGGLGEGLEHGGSRSGGGRGCYRRRRYFCNRQKSQRRTPALSSSSINCGMISKRSPMSATSASLTSGASASVLMATIFLAPWMPARCCSAPEIPMAI